MKYNIWFIEDDKYLPICFKDIVEANELNDKLEIEIFDKLPNLENSPDMIILDIGCIGSLYFDGWNELYRNLHNFVSSHSGSILILVSGMESYIEDFTLELEKDFKDLITIEKLEKGMSSYQSLVDIIKKYVKG